MSKKFTFAEQIKLSDIAVLIAVINTGSMRAAAQKCGITQPHVSMIIKNMEEYLGQRLLLRSHAGVQPTNAGITLSKYGASALAEIQAGLRDLANQDKNDNGPIKIGIIQLFGGGLPITAILRFAQMFPHVNLSIVNYDNSSRAVLALEENRIDFVFGRLYDPTHFRHDTIRVETLIPGELIIVTGRNSPLIKDNKGATLSQLIEHPWIRRDPEDLTEMPLRSLLKKRRLTTNKYIETDSYAVIYRLITEHNFIAAVPDRVAQFLHLARLNVDIPVIPLPLVMLSRTSIYERNIHLKFHEFMLNMISSLYQADRSIDYDIPREITI